MRKKRLTTLLLVFLLIFSSAPLALAEEDPTAETPVAIQPDPVADVGFDLDIDANGIYLMSLDTGEVLYQKNADLQVHPASTTKIMATALAMELCEDLDGTIVTVPDDIWAEFEGLNVSHAGLKAGEQISMRDLLYCMMLQSANEAASTVAAFFGREEFIRLMNEKAAELGCENTNFTNPHGCFVKDHYTTAYDLSRITRWALTVPGFWEMSQQARYTKAATNKNEEVTLVSTIQMQDPTSRYYTSYIRGVKTGTLSEAGRCLVSTAQKDGMTYLLVLLGAPFDTSNRVWNEGDSSFTATRLIYEWVFANLELANIVDETTIVGQAPLRYAAGRDNLLLYPEGNLYTVVRKDVEEPPEIRYEFEMPDTVKAPVEAGDVVTTANVYYGNRLIGEINLVSRETINSSVFVIVIDTFTRILSSTAAKIIYVALFLFILLYLYYMLIVVPRARKRHQAKKRGGSQTSQKRRR